jgi:hypothetical protein
MSSSLFWLGSFLLGFVLGLFVKPQAVAIGGAVLMAVDFTGMLLLALLPNSGVSELSWKLGIAMLLIPVSFAVATVGAVVSQKFKSMLL